MLKLKLIFVIFLFLCSIKNGFCYSVKNDRGETRDLTLKPFDYTAICKGNEQINELNPTLMSGGHALHSVEITGCAIQEDKTMLNLAGNIPIYWMLHLKIKSKHFSYLNYDFLSGLHGLTNLRLENVSFRDMSAIEKLPNILVLKLVMNFIIIFHKLNLPFLQELDISENDIVFIDSEAFTNMPNLRTVIINSNTLKSIPDDSFSFKNTLVSEFQLISGYKEMKSIDRYFLRHFNHLKTVTINTGLTKINYDFFKNKTSIVSINLSKNDLLTIPVDLFRTLSYLRELDLSHNNIENLDESIFTDNYSLRTIKLSHNNIIELSQSLFDSCLRLERLYINNNKIHNFEFDLDDHTDVEYVNLGNNRLVFNEKCLFTNLENDLELILSNNNIHNLRSLSCLINSTVTELDLSENRIEKILMSDIDFKRAEHLKLNLTNNNIKEIEFWNSLEFKLESNVSSKSTIDIVVDGNPLFCTTCLFLRNRDNLKKLNTKLKFEEIEIKFISTNTTSN